MKLQPKKTEAESKVERELAQATQNINSASTNEVDQAKQVVRMLLI